MVKKEGVLVAIWKKHKGCKCNLLLGLIRIDKFIVLKFKFETNNN